MYWFFHCTIVGIFKVNFRIMKSLIILLGLVVLLSSCATGATLRTARVLEKGQFEISGGAAGTQFGNVSQVVIAAYGVKENIEIEGRCEDEYIAFTPRLQILKSETSIIDCLTFFELGYSGHGGFQWGPGITIGRRWNFIEPYISYRFRHFSSISERQQGNKKFQKDFLGASNFHYLKFGSRLYLPCFWSNTEQRTSKWFIGVEVGSTIFASDAVFEWAANIGFDY
jgi:hypothetical protein